MTPRKSRLLTTMLGLILTLALPHSALALDDLAGIAGWCEQNPGQCQALKDKFEAQCKTDPARCDEAKARLAKAQEACRANPSACEQKQAELKDRLRQRLEEECQRNPDRCIRIKERLGNGQ